MRTCNQPPRIHELLADHQSAHRDNSRGEILDIQTTCQHDGIYNGTAPIDIGGGKQVIAQRVDLPNVKKSDVQFFHKNGVLNRWDYDESLPVMHGLEDPFYTIVGNKNYFGGVRTYNDPVTGDIVDWDSAIWVVDNLGDLDDNRPPDIVGGRHAKGLRPLSKDGELVGMFYRPPSGQYPRGKESFLPVRRMEEVTADKLASAPVVEGFIADGIGEWGGITWASYLNERFVLAGMHLARFAVGGVTKEYYGGLLLLEEELVKGRFARLKVVAQKIATCRACFPNEDAQGNIITPKSPELESVSYLTAISLKEKAGYAGVSDAVSGRLVIEQDLDELEGLAV